VDLSLSGTSIFYYFGVMPFACAGACNALNPAPAECSCTETKKFGYWKLGHKKQEVEGL
jgi:hypothetical protein